MKVEHIKVTGFEETLRGMRNPYDSWEKSDSYVIPNVIPGTEEFERKLKTFQPNLITKDSKPDFGVVTNIKNGTVGETIQYDPWSQLYFIPEDKIDSEKYDHEDLKIATDNVVLIGKNDIDLMQRLIVSDYGKNNGGEPNEKFLRYPMVTMDITGSFDFWKEFDTYKVGTVADSCSTMHTITKHPITIENFSTADLRPEDIKVIEKVWIPILNERINDDSLDNLEKTRILSKMNLVGFEQKRTIKMNYANMRNMSVWRAGHKLYEWRKLVNVYFKNFPYYKSLFESNSYIKTDKE